SRWWKQVHFGSETGSWSRSGAGTLRPRSSSFLSIEARRARQSRRRGLEQGAHSEKKESRMADRRYTRSHEWVAVDGKHATIGITDFAQSQLGDVVFLELPSVGRKLAARETFG